jgi:signal transduction histidine kinase
LESKTIDEVVDLPATGSPVAALAAPPPVQWWTSALAATATVVGASICVGPLWASQPKVAGPAVMFAGALVAVGVILRGEPGQAGAARILITAGCLWPLGWVDAWAGGPWPLIAIFGSPLALILTGWAIYRYPDAAAVGKWERWSLRALALWVVIGRMGVIATSHPTWRGHPADSWWLTLWPDRQLNHALLIAAATGQVVLLAPFLTQWVRRFRRVQGLDRRLMGPVVGAASVGGTASVGVGIASVTGLSDLTMDRLYAIQSTLLLLVPIAFATAALRRRLTSSVIADLVPRLRRRPTPENLERSFQEALADPGLRIYYWSADLACHVDRRGQIFDSRLEPGTGLQLPVTTATGEPLAMIQADDALRRYPDLVAAVVSVGALAVENVRLQVATRAQLEQMRASHARIIDVGLAERQALERDLNTGALKRIRTLLDALTSDRSVVPAQLTPVLGHTSDQLGEVVVELRDIAGGLHPSILDEVGLVEAVTRMCRSQPIPVTVDLPRRAYPISVEVAAYYVIAEALTNAVRHAEASWIRIEGVDTGTALRIAVQDNGKGGADMDGGTGLMGLSERVRSLSGEVSLISPLMVGTILTVEIPCG